MDIIQSFIFSAGRAPLSLYEQRLLVKIVEYGQKVVKNLPMAQNLRKLKHDLDNVKIVLPAKYVLDNDSHHYELIYSAARTLMARTYEFFDAASNCWYASPLIYNVKVERGSGRVTFYVARSLYDIIFNMELGYRQYDLASALSLPSVTATRLYILMSGQKRPLTLSVENIKKMFGLSDKYSRSSDLIKRVIEPAKKVLDDSKVTSFTFSANKEGRKIVSLTFFAVQRVAHADDDVSVVGFSQEYVAVRAFLMKYAEFSFKEIMPNSKLLVRFAKMPDPLDLLSYIVGRSRRAENPKGYIINAIKKELSNA